MANVLITGANRGIGLEFTRQLLGRGERVFAAVRSPEKSGQLRGLRGNLKVIKLDAGDAETIKSARESVAAESNTLHLLINNAGVYDEKRLGALDYENGVNMMRVNAVAPFIIAQEFLPLLKRAAGGAKIVHITSGYGSVSGNEGSFPYFYSGSKAALNMMNRSLAHDLKPSGITSIVLSPGWVRTDMGTDAAPLSPEQSVTGMLRVIDRLTPADTGKFLNYEGNEEPW